MDGVRILQTGNAGYHLHLLLKFSNRTCYLAFIRSLTGTMVRRICGPSALALQFFDFRPFSRLVSGGRRDFLTTRAYVELNEREGRGHALSEIGEDSKSALLRELKEEKEAEVQVGRLFWIVEDFFEHEARTTINLDFIMKSNSPARLQDPRF